MVHKGYISTEQQREKPEDRVVDYTFTSNPDSAMFWSTKEEADAACMIFDSRRIVIPSANGGKHCCSGFTTEERKPNEFVVFCHAPFIPRHPSDAPGSECGQV
jgi:hypothetical protein